MGVSIAQQLFTYMDSVSDNFVATNLSNVILGVTPVVAAALSCVLAFEGAQLMMNPNAEPLSTLMQRFFRWGIILSFATAGGLYQTQIAHAITTAPDQFAQLFVISNGTNASTGQNQMATTIDTMLDQGLRTAGTAWNSASVWDSQGWALMFEAVVIILSTTIVVGFGMAFIIFAKFMLAVAVALGPIAIFCLLFKATTNLFGKWVSVCLHYGLITVLLSITFGLLLAFFSKSIQLTAAQDSSSIFGGMATCIILAVVAVIVTMQVPEMASRLGDGVAIAAPTIANAISGGKSVRDGMQAKAARAETSKATQAMGRAAQAMESAASSMGGPAGAAAGAAASAGRGLARGSAR